MESSSSRNYSGKWVCFVSERAEIFTTGALILVGYWRVNTGDSWVGIPLI